LIKNRIALIAGARLEKRESQMAWTAPKIVEVSVGMEINMYMCATRK
jgi:coenzyme PQQ precursor peptide PqqA